jgi:hypothetical protein
LRDVESSDAARHIALGLLPPDMPYRGTEELRFMPAFSLVCK